MKKIYGKFGFSEQVIDFTGSYIPEEGYVEVKTERPDTNYILGDDLEWKMFTPVPEELTRFQAIVVLKLNKLEDGTSLYDATDMYMNSLPTDDVNNIIAKTAWETAQSFQRNSQMILMMQDKFNLPKEKVDQLFIYGSSIVV